MDIVFQFMDIAAFLNSLFTWKYPLRSVIGLVIYVIIGHGSNHLDRTTRTEPLGPDHLDRTIWNEPLGPNHLDKIAIHIKYIILRYG